MGAYIVLQMRHEVMRLFDSTLCRFLASQCVQESCLGNSPHVVRDVQLPPASYSTSLQSDLTLSSTLACCGSTYKPESASFVVINTWILTDYRGQLRWEARGVRLNDTMSIRFGPILLLRCCAVLKYRHKFTTEKPMHFFEFFVRIVRYMHKGKKRMGD